MGSPASDKYLIQSSAKWGRKPWEDVDHDPPDADLRKMLASRIEAQGWSPSDAATISDYLVWLETLPPPAPLPPALKALMRFPAPGESSQERPSVAELLEQRNSIASIQLARYRKGPL